jgi:hypothetical protein
MIVFHCTGKVRRRFGLEVHEGEVETTSSLGNWYANLLNIGRTRWVLCLSEASLLPVLVPARKAEFPATFPTRLESVLRGIGVPDEVARREAEESSRWRFDKTRSRSVLGSMNDFAFQFEFVFRTTEDPTLAALRLADMPCGPLDLGFPDRTAFCLLGIEGEPRRHLSGPD